VTAGLASAVPTGCLPSGSFADLLATNADGGCFIADKLYSSFTFSANATGSSIALTADQFDYTAVANPPAAVGFQFAFALGALQNSSNTVEIGWIVASPSPSIVSDHLGFTATAINNASATIDETFCLGGPVAGCAAANTGQLNVFTGPAIGTRLADSTSFSVVDTLGVFKTIEVTAGAASFANISSMTQTVDQLPEPGTGIVLISGLVVLGLIRRRIS
jgi:hypothetical protein